MKKQKINVNLPIEQIIEEAATIEVWEKVSPRNIKIGSFHLEGGKVISATGTVAFDGKINHCIWNYQGICLDRLTMTVIEEGCL